MISRNMFQKVILLITVGLLVGCVINAEPPAIGEIKAQSTTITTGGKVPLTIDVSGTDLKFEWSALNGSLTDPTQPNVIYTAPDTPGPDTVTVKVRYSGGEIIKAINFEVLAPPPPPEPTATNTPLPTDTPVPTAVPDAVVCDVPAITRDLFPQLEEINKRFAFRGPVDDPTFECQGVYDIFHDKAMAVRIKYENVDRNFGFWGIGVPTDLPFDITSYSQICFWAYAQKPGQSFRLKMKDTSPPPNEDGLTIILGEANTWEQICTDLSEFSSLGIELDKLENINLGFEQPTGSAEIWIDDFELK